jgi:hypothetical protein
MIISTTDCHHVPGTDTKLQCFCQTVKVTADRDRDYGDGDDSKVPA